ncbi:hypothetical protein D3C80_1044230 [compost metagenome]
MRRRIDPLFELGRGFIGALQLEPKTVRPVLQLPTACRLGRVWLDEGGKGHPKGDLPRSERAEPFDRPGQGVQLDVVVDRGAAIGTWCIGGDRVLYDQGHHVVGGSDRSRQVRDAVAVPLEQGLVVTLVGVLGQMGEHWRRPSGGGDHEGANGFRPPVGVMGPGLRGEAAGEGRSSACRLNGCELLVSRRA